MVSTFSGLEVAKRGMMAQQAALSVTGHNIANASTSGYTRQRVNFVQTTPYPAPSMNRPMIPGQIGTGVEAGSIQRVRDQFLDDQFRGESSKLGYWSTQSQALSSLEVIMNEPTDEGLANSLDLFWNSLQDLSSTPQDSGARSVVRQRGLALADTFNYVYSNLKAVQGDYKQEIEVSQKSINSVLSQINKVNQQISEIEVHGYIPNDLYDQRDRLVDDLSSYINIKVQTKSSGGLSNAAAEGGYDIYLTDNNGQIMKDSSGKEMKLVDFEKNTAVGISLKYDDNHPNQPVNGIEFFDLHPEGAGFNGFLTDPSSSTATFSINSFQDFKDNSTGSFISNIESYGYKSGEEVKGLYTDMMKNLDEMAFVFAKEFNAVHQSGWSITEIDKGVKNGKDFFTFDNKIAKPTEGNVTGAAASLRVSSDIIESLENIAAAQGTKISDETEEDAAFVGNGSNASALANVKDEILKYGTSSTTITGFYQSVIGDMGVRALQANQMAKNTEVLRESVISNRESLSSVSLDEEMTNLIQFQHAYNASARMITIVDEMLDRVINSMGLVGR